MGEMERNKKEREKKEKKNILLVFKKLPKSPDVSEAKTHAQSHI